MKEVEKIAKRTKLGRRVVQASRGMRALRLLRSILAIVLGLVLVLVLIVALAYLLSDRSNGKLTVSTGEERRYLLYVPSTYDPATPTPLVISLHGYADMPAFLERVSHWDDLAEQEGFIVVYPSGLELPKRWRAYGGTDADVIFISELIDSLAGQYNIDPARIYANGLSNGAGMSVRLACELPSRIAAIGLVSGAYLLPWEDCLSERPVPAVVFHGTADPVVPFSGGPSRSFDEPFPPILEWADALAQRNGCRGVTPLPDVGAVSGVRYTDCMADVDLYIIDGGGHAWPGGEPIAEWIVGETTRDINATAVIWEFFKTHPLR